MKKITFACATVLMMAAVSSQAFAETGKTHDTTQPRVTQKVTRAATVVNNFEELKSALEENNGITEITLGADITLSDGIRVNPAKTAITIDGDNHNLIETLQGISGTIYIGDNNGTQDVTLKNISVEGKNFYGPINVDDLVYGVTLNYENVTYHGPQLAHNVHGFANFTGTNNIDIVTNGQGSNDGQEIFEGLGVTIAGEFTAIHEGVNDSAFWFGLGNDERPYLTIKDDAKVSVDVKVNTLFYVDNADAHPLDITIGKNAQFDVKTQRELFRLGHAGNVDLLDDSSTTITRSSNLNTEATVNLDDSIFTVNPTASLEIVHAQETQAPIFRARNNSLIDFNTAKSLELKAPASAKVFDAQDTQLNVKTSTLEAWHGSDATDPDYQNSTPLDAEFLFGDDGVSIIASNQPDILTHWNIMQTNHLLFSGEDTTAPDKPVLNDALTDQSTAFVGTAEPNSTVTVYAEDRTVVATGTADENGNFSIPVPSSLVLVAGDKYYVTSKDGAGNESEASDLVTVKDVTAPDKPVLNGLTTGSTIFVGTAEPGAIIEIFTGSVAGPVATGQADGNGNFSIPVPSSITLTVGEEFYARATDAAGNKSEPSGIITVTEASGN